MPGGDRTGPLGQGPMTGWGMGWCRGARGPVGFGPRGGGFGRGRGGSRGGGRGHRNWFYATGLTGWQRARGPWVGPGAWSAAPLPHDQELAAMRQESSDLEQQLADLRTRIRDLESAGADEAPAREGESR